MLKRIMSMLLALVLCAGCAGALAAEGPRTFEMPAAGLTFVFPQAYENARGWIGTDGVMELGAGSGSYYLYFYYCAVPAEEFPVLMAETPDMLMPRTSLLFYAFALGGGKDFSEVTRVTGGDLKAEDALLLGQEGDWTFYLYQMEDPAFAAALEEDYREEYGALCAARDQAAASFTCSMPLNEHSDREGFVIRFTGTDLDGNPVSSEELFARHEVTMVNVWATWCGPCVGEEAALQEIHTRFLTRDCAVVGLMTDDDVAEARRLLEENGVSYDVVLVPPEFSFVFPVTSIPTSFFVDRGGSYLGVKLEGAYPELYEPALESLIGK